MQLEHQAQYYGDEVHFCDFQTKAHQQDGHDIVLQGRCTGVWVRVGVIANIFSRKYQDSGQEKHEQNSLANR